MASSTSRTPEATVIVVSPTRSSSWQRPAPVLRRTIRVTTKTRSRAEKRIVTDMRSRPCEIRSLTLPRPMRETLP